MAGLGVAYGVWFRCVLEGMLAYERATGGTAAITAARRRGEEYLLERGLFRRLSTGEVADPDWLQFSFPVRWHYDVLRALEYFRAVGNRPDTRIDEAVQLLQSKRQPDGTWLLENTHPGEVHFQLEEGDGRSAGGTPCGPCVCCAGTSRRLPDFRRTSDQVAADVS